MKYIPEANYMICHALVPKVTSMIVLPNGTTTKGITRHYLIELVGPDAAKEGYKPGDLVIAEYCTEMHLFREHRALIHSGMGRYGTKLISVKCQDYNLEDFVTLVGEKPADEVAKKFLQPSNGAAEVTGVPA